MKNSIHCLCCEKQIPETRPIICPECGHVFQGNGWGGIDAHWRAKHEENVMTYEDFWHLFAININHKCNSKKLTLL